ncbi:MAG TPA: carbohydrate-binding protein [Kineosporiaceae bacterium]|nr:carbohydrate-binding protein [Kineosporiaceae bacterium]
MSNPLPPVKPWRARWSRLAATAAFVTAVTAVPALLTAGAQAAVPPPQAGFTTVFSDDFSGPAGVGVNRGNWLYSLGHKYTGGPDNKGGADNWGTGEIQEMTDSTANAATDGSGHLAITPLRDSAGKWTSARIETNRTDFAAPAGGIMRVEASLQQPDVTTANGAAYWPAFWMLGADARPMAAQNWPSIGEIDIMENVNGLNSVFSTLHCGTAEGGPCNETTGIGSGKRDCLGCNSGFHTYAMELDRSVSPEQIRYYQDGALAFTTFADQFDAETWAKTTHHGFFLIFNVSIGGGFPKAFGHVIPNEATVPGKPMLIDYVSVSTKERIPPTSTPTPTPTTTITTLDAYAKIQAEGSGSQSGTTTETTTDPDGGGQNVAAIGNGDWLRYPGVNFGSTPAHQFSVRAASGVANGANGLVEVRLDNRNNAPIATIAIGNTGGWQNWRTVPTNVSALTGTHDVYLTFSSGQPDSFVNINWFTYAR